MNDVERLGGRVVLLDEGKVRLDRQLDQIREELLRRHDSPQRGRRRAAIESLPGCLRARPVFDDWHAVFRGHARRGPPPIAAKPLGLDGIHCVSVPLEELFVELVGGNR